MLSSICHFFVHLLKVRGYFTQFRNLEEFEFPEHLIAARSVGAFPDMILRRNHILNTGGEFVELKTTQSYTIASFNSTIPSQ